MGELCYVSLGGCMSLDQQKWNRTYSIRGDVLSHPEDFILRRLWGPPASILDVACGDGRNAIPLVKLGYQVTGVDISDVGLGRLQAALPPNSSIQLQRLDLTQPTSLFPLGTFDYVIISRFKPVLALWNGLAKSVKPGGMLILCTFNELQAKNGFPLRFCLQEGELKTIHPDLNCREYIRFQEGGRELDGYVFTLDHGDKP